MTAPAEADRDDDAAGRRRRGLIIALIILVVGVPTVLASRVSEWMVDRQADQLGDDVLEAARSIDVDQLAADDAAAAWGTEDTHPLIDALGHGGEFSSARFAAGEITVAYRTQWFLAERCVVVTLGSDYRGVRTTDGSCP